VCEAGFPVASQGDFEAVMKIAQEVGPLTAGRKEGQMIIAALARCTKRDIDRAYEALKYAPRFRIHTFLGSSDIHLKYKLRITREECLKQVREWVSYAKGLAQDVEFSPEDAGRTEPKFLSQVLATAVEAGATVLNIPDTVGYNTPEMYGQTLRYLIENTKGSDKVIWSTHCHNDLGLATANSLAGILAGCRQVEVAVNGIGERAGNTALEEVVMAVHTHSKLYPVYTSIDTTQIMKISRLVSTYTGMLVQPNKAIVGMNAFAHESGIHQDGVLKHQSTYEIIEPQTIGLDKNKMVLGKHSGRHAFRKRLEELGFELSEDNLNKAFKTFKALADSQKELTDFDLIAIARDESQNVEYWKLNYVQVHCGDRLQPTAIVSISDSATGKEIVETSIGVGPVDAVYTAINKIVNLPNKLNEYTVKSVTQGLTSLGEVYVTVSPIRTEGSVGNAVTCHAHGAHYDIIVASARAFLHALNKLKTVLDSNISGVKGVKTI